LSACRWASPSYSDSHDGEVYFQLLENVRGVDVFLVQPTCNPVDEHLMELLIMMDALKRASAGRITVVMPYYGYARQDRKAPAEGGDYGQAGGGSAEHGRCKPRPAGRSARSADSGLLNIPVDHLFASPVLVSYFRAAWAARPDGDIAGRGRRGARRASSLR